MYSTRWGLSALASYTSSKQMMDGQRQLTITVSLSPHFSYYTTTTTTAITEPFVLLCVYVSCCFKKEEAAAASTDRGRSPCEIQSTLDELRRIAPFHQSDAHSFLLLLVSAGATANECVAIIQKEANIHAAFHAVCTRCVRAVSREKIITSTQRLSS